MRWIFSFSLIAFLLLCRSLPSSANEKSVLNPLSRALGKDLQWETQLADASFYNQKLGVHIKRGGRFRKRAGTRSSAIRNQRSSFHVGSVLCISLFLSFFIMS
ncbi:hypothetical protein I3760_16G109400 [Carya illinoinensis]|nr:hypothetical protein I3760_16G109400 [Carya illinoinensis]